MQPRQPGNRRGRSLGSSADSARRAVEIAASSVEEAVRLALQQLNLNEDEVEIEVLEDPTLHDVEEALVRVTPLPAGQVAAARRPDVGNLRDPRDDRAVEDDVDDAGNVASNDALLVIALEIVEDLVDLMGLQAAVRAVEPPLRQEPDEPPTVGVEIVGPDLGVLIGRRGDMLAQFQYLVTLLVNRRVGGFHRIVVDVGGYKRRREETLISLAERMAQRVSQSRRPLALEAMPASERRVIHLALKESAYVYTESQGEGDARRIVIYPR